MTSNPFESTVERLAEAMQKESDRLASHADGVPPAFSKKLTDGEEAFFFDNPAQFYPDETLTNAQAAQRMLQDFGPVQYVKWCESQAKRLAKENG